MRQASVEAIPVNRTLLPFPKVIIFEIVGGCNLRCIMCPHSQLTRPKGLMSLDLYKRLIDEIASHDRFQTEVWATIMGEVFVHGHAVFDYLDYAKQAGLQKIYLNSNMVRFEESMLDRLERCGLNKLTVGIDAATRETYDKIRVGGDFDRVEHNIRFLLDAKRQGRLPELELVLQFIVQDFNEHEEEAFKAKWMGQGATLKIRPRLGWGTGVPAPNLCLPDEVRTMPCPWLMRTMSIHWTGHVAQCDAEWNGERYVGDLNRQTIEEVWLGELLGKRQRHLNLDFSQEPCRDCKDWQCGLSEVYPASRVAAAV
ncbi:MAG: radical SAM/SPASM domain-containing protein [Bryobacteraceae bacterium]